MDLKQWRETEQNVGRRAGKEGLAREEEAVDDSCSTFDHNAGILEEREVVEEGFEVDFTARVMLA